MQDHTTQKIADIAGALFSQLCLVHCLLLPILLALVPSLSLGGIFQGETFHLAALLLTTPVVVFALRTGLARHGSTRPSALGYAALAFLWLVFLGEELIGHDLVAAFNVTGGFLMAWAHWQNWTLTRVSSCCCH